MSALEAVQRPDDHDRPEMVGQFVLDRGTGDVPQLWESCRIGPWRLSYHPALPVRTIRASDDAPMGWLLGLAIGPEGHLIDGDWCLPVGSDHPDIGSRFESTLRELAGRYVAIGLFGGGRVYLDGCGSLAAVYCPDQERVASSPNLIPRSKSCGDDESLALALGIPQRDNWYPFGLTPRHGIERLLPNHHLDLTRWTAHRHWPPADLAAGTAEPQAAVSAIGSLVERTIAAVTRAHPAQMPLTAGRDSRILLACARPNLSRIRSYTTAIPDARARQDCRTARALARRHGLDHEVVEWKEASASELSTWLYRTGTCAAGRIWKGTRTEKQLDPARVTISGLAGDVCRPVYWRKSPSSTSPLSWSDLLDRLRLPALEQLEGRAQLWLDEVPLRDTYAILNLLFIEQRQGCWAGPSLYGSLTNQGIVLPFNSTRIFQLIMSLSHEYRKERLLVPDLIRARWPELLELPFNEPIGWRRRLSKAKQIASGIVPPRFRPGAKKTARRPH